MCGSGSIALGLLAGQFLLIGLSLFSLILPLLLLRIQNLSAKSSYRVIASYYVVGYRVIELMPSGNARSKAHTIPCNQMFVGSLIVTLLVGYCADAAGVQQARKFCWSAALDRKTGEATATEISTCTPRRRSNRASDQYAPITSCDDKFLIDLIKSYPVWLSRPSVSFGVLRTSVLSKQRDVTCTRIDRTRAPNRIDAQQGSAIGISINDSLFGLNLLCFGIPRSSVTTIRANGGNRRRSIQVDFPVIGGLLDGKRQAQAATSTNDISEHGRIRFVIEQEEVKMQDTCKEKSRRSQTLWSNVRIESSICDGYCPAISGGAPVNALRKAAYLSLQSLVHAYVMWRFHGKIWAGT